MSSSSSLYIISITLLVLILTVESAYYAYTYADGDGSEEHCCVVRVRDNFCLATPITRSLIQVDQQCQPSDAPKHRRFSAKKRNDDYSKTISRRLNVQMSREIGDKILLELKTPLGKDILDKDLVCLASTNNNINLEKCYVELVDEMDDDDEEHDRRSHRGHKRQKYVVIKKTEKHDDDKIIDAEKEVRRVEIGQPVRIREGHGLAIRRTYQLNPNNIQPVTRRERQCWSWYRKQTKKMRHNPSKYNKICIDLNDHRESCIHELVYQSSNQTDANRPEQETLSLPFGSKLFCENHSSPSKLIGFHYHGEICFQSHNQLYIEYQFTDIASLSDKHKNKDTLQLIADNKKLMAEFENDCNGQTTLDEIIDPEKKPKSTTGHKSIKH